jgi:hypothetical protein
MKNSNRKPPLARMAALAGIMLLCANVALSQGDLRADSSFFQSRMATYQKWLDHAGLGKMLRVHQVQVLADELALYLAFPFSNADSVTTAWWQLKNEFQQHSSLSLEQQLFFKMTHILELPQELGNVQLYDTYDPRAEPCFYRGIYFDSTNAELKVDSNSCKAISREIDFDPSDFSRLRKAATFDWNSGQIGHHTLSPAELRRRYPKSEVFDLIEKYACAHFRSQPCGDRVPEFHVLQRKQLLRFEVANLCKVVLDGENHALCSLLSSLGYSCNWAKREKLIFTFTYRDSPQGFVLDCSIDGLVGSGYYETVRRGGYINMEVDFDQELEFFADRFKEDIRLLLKNNY